MSDDTDMAIDAACDLAPTGQNTIPDEVIPVGCPSFEGIE